ncbi:MAG: cobalamin-dependent protein [Deltaproteobacteria bacterium]|nr:cobalamin-dependent protein [Deltaproteobacteria bacterium]
MILFVEPVSKYIDMYVPAFPLPILEIASFIKCRQPEVELEVISLPVDYGLPLSQEGKETVYSLFLRDLVSLKPKGIGISCTAIAQAEGVIELCERIKAHDPDIFLFLGGYFPTIYHEEILKRTNAVDLIVAGEGEESALRIVECLEQGLDPRAMDIPGLVWRGQGKTVFTEKGPRFDLRKKELLNPALLRYPRAYDILPYSFSRGCPYHCIFCMEEFLRPIRKMVPEDIVKNDLTRLVEESEVRTVVVSDALFMSFDLFPFFKSLGLKVNFETRCDIMDPAVIPKIGDTCGMLALGFESASYGTLKRMNKVRDRAHYKKYLANTANIFREAVKQGIPVMVFMIAGFPGDTLEDLEESLTFAKALSKNSGSGGHVFKIGECHVYPETRIHTLATSLPDVVFDDDGVFGQNIVRKPSKDLGFQTVLDYSKRIYELSNMTSKFEANMSEMMPFFRVPAVALKDEMVPDRCFADPTRNVIDARKASLAAFRALTPGLKKKYQQWLTKERSLRSLQL